MTTPAHRRLMKEYRAFKADPPQYIQTKPDESNLLVWHYLIEGPPETPYSGGEFHGTVTFPANYPFAPPQIKMITPNGRFAVNTPLCLTISDFHPETWNPAWGISTILVALLSFMTGDDITTGSLQAPIELCQELARKSHTWNRSANAAFIKTWPEYCEIRRPITDENSVDIQVQEQFKSEFSAIFSYSKESDALPVVKRLLQIYARKSLIVRLVHARCMKFILYGIPYPKLVKFPAVLEHVNSYFMHLQSECTDVDHRPYTFARILNTNDSFEVWNALYTKELPRLLVQEASFFPEDFPLQVLSSQCTATRCLPRPCLNYICPQPVRVPLRKKHTSRRFDTCEEDEELHHKKRHI